MTDFLKFTKNGIEFVGFQDVRALLREDWNRAFGVELDYSETSPDGHHIDLEAKTINSVAEMVQGVCSNLNRSTATGQFLDFLAAFIPLTRNEGETDDQLRARMDSADIDGYCTPSGMETQLMDSIGNDISLSINDEDVVYDGITPHSFRVTVPQSNTTSDNDIAQAIFNCKGAGIKSCGNVSATAVFKGREFPIRFSRPVDVSVDFKVVIHRYGEEAFPVDGVEQIKNNINAWATGETPYKVAEYKPGKDVIPSRIFVPILRVPGIKYPEISVRREGGDWTPNVISISSEETAVINEIQVEVLDE